jgi:hypothetical protein
MPNPALSEKDTTNVIRSARAIDPKGSGSTTPTNEPTRDAPGSGTGGPTAGTRVQPVDIVKSKVSIVVAKAADEIRAGPSANAPILKNLLNIINPSRWDVRARLRNEAQAIDLHSATIRFS